MDNPADTIETIKKLFANGLCFYCAVPAPSLLSDTWHTKKVFDGYSGPAPIYHTETLNAFHLPTIDAWAAIGVGVAVGSALTWLLYAIHFVGKKAAEH